MGQRAQVRGQLGSKGSVRSIEITQEHPGSLGADITQQNALGPHVTIFYCKEAFTVYLREKRVQKSYQLDSCDLGQNRPQGGSGSL